MLVSHIKPVYNNLKLQVEIIINQDKVRRLSLVIFWQDPERGSGAVEDKTALLSRRVCGDLGETFVRDSMRADA